MDEANRKLNVHARLGSTHYESQCSMAEHYVASLDAVTNTWRTVLSSLRPTSTFKAEDLTGYLLPTGMDPYLQQCEPLVDIPALACVGFFSLPPTTRLTLGAEQLQNDHPVLCHLALEHPVGRLGQSPSLEVGSNRCRVGQELLARCRRYSSVCLTSWSVHLLLL
jgi:hypothetical protein